MAQTFAFGQVLSDQSVGVFVGAAFPGVVGRGEVAGGSAVLLKFLVVVELGAVVEGDGVEGVLGAADDRSAASVAARAVRSGRSRMTVKPLLRSTRVKRQCLVSLPMTVSPSQSPMRERSLTHAGVR